MKFHHHSWTLWVPYDHFIDTSYGDRMHKTVQVRRCRKCGLTSSKSTSHWLPINEADIDAVMDAPRQWQARKRRLRARGETTDA